MKDRLIGLDINGWHDFAVRNWLLDRDGTEGSIPEGQTIDGGTLSRVVSVGDENWTMVGGPRAQLALHGRGPGWGDFGNETRRVLIRRSDDPKAWGTSMRELGATPRIAVLAVPDHPGMDETARESRLEAMRALRARQSLLVWSSVALALVECTNISVEGGQKLGIMELGSEGFLLQTLDIVERNELLTPRRRSFGKLVPSSLALSLREKQTLEHMTQEINDPRVARALNLADLPALLAMAAPGELMTELVRLDNGDWYEAAGETPSTTSDLDVAEFFSDCERVILHGPCSPSLLRRIASEQEKHSGLTFEVAPQNAVAHGAFLVATRLRQGLPPWFDYLPNVSTIVQDRDEVYSLSLVNADEVAEAGKVWKSTKPVDLVWQARSERIEVWLKKEDDPRPRFSPAVVQDAPPQDQKVQLYLEQQPAQGRAVLRIVSDTWPELRDRPAIVDWEAGKHDDQGRDWETIIEDFKVRPPIVPERVVLPAHWELWYPDQGGGLAEAVREFDGRDYEPIYRALSARRQVYFNNPDHPEHNRQFYAIDSDGGRPTGVKDNDWDLLNAVIAKAEAEFTASRVSNNYALGVLSWSFRLCPPTIWPIVAKVLKTKGGSPAFPGWQTMYPQAFGRIASGKPAFKGVIEYLNGLETPWNKNQQACAAFLLSRNNEVFALLEATTINRWTKSACLSLTEGLRGGFSQRHQYLPILIAGLLRWRIREPMAFTKDYDETAQILLDRLERTVRTKGLRSKDHSAYETVLNAIQDHGARPDLLQTLFDLL